MSELIPCPFCGWEFAEHAWNEFGEEYRDCDQCGATSGTVNWMWDWQSRPIEDALRKRIAELESQLEEHEVMKNRVAELEAENIRLGIEYQRMRLALGDIAINSKRALKESPTDHLTARWRQERQDDKSSNDTQTDTFVYGKERER